MPRHRLRASALSRTRKTPVRDPLGFPIGLLAAIVVLGGGGTLPVGAQSTTMPSTLRYGSGYWDVPVASVLPHLTVTATYSGFSIDVPEVPLVDEAGDRVGRGGPFETWSSDVSVALGLLDRFEVGGTFQNFADSASGGNMVGGFGRILLLQPERYGGLGLATGLRYVSAPTFVGEEGAPARPGRLGFPDRRIRRNFPGKEDVKTRFSPYVVASGNLPGFEAPFLPSNDVSFSVGWGDGLFRDGGDLEWHGPISSRGWFLGSALHLRLIRSTLLHLVGDFNGFDVNLGAQLDVGGIRLGGYVLGVNYSEDRSRYRSRKVGLVASVSFCAEEGGLCGPRLRAREHPDTIRLPAPPPDTVIIDRRGPPPLPEGEVVHLCLATGEEVEVVVTSRGDTLVGPERISVERLGGMAFAGTYAGQRQWFVEDRPIEVQGRTYGKVGGEARPTCDELVPSGERAGVPLFAPAGSEAPHGELWVPVRPGVWQRYRSEGRDPAGQARWR